VRKKAEEYFLGYSGHGERNGERNGHDKGGDGSKTEEESDKLEEASKREAEMYGPFLGLGLLKSNEGEQIMKEMFPDPIMNSDEPESLAREGNPWLNP